MRKIAEIILSSFLRRYPLPTRLSLFSYLGQYAWLKDLLEALRPELFPASAEDLETAAVEAAAPQLDDSVLGILDGSEIRGRIGYYKAETYLGQRGNGHLFAAIEVTSKRPVVIKEFLLPAASFTKAEAYQRQNSFQRLAGIHLADGRILDFRVIQPLEAIADTASHERCFLVSDDRDRATTLRQHLQKAGVLPTPIVREILSQILQTLDFLHKQKFSFPTGAIQNGLVHGNLSLDSILWTEQHSQPFVYLCDLQLWEQCFDPAKHDWRSTQVTTTAIQQDLQAVGKLGSVLLQGLEPSPAVVVDPWLQTILTSLQTSKFDSAETARRELIRLAALAPAAIAPLAEATAQPKPKSQAVPLIALAAIGGLALGAFVLWPRLRSTEARSTSPPKISACCLAEVSAIPVGEYTYTSVEDGTWWNVLQQSNLLQRGRSFTSALAATQPKLQLRYVPAASIDETLAKVRSGTADFAVLPLLDALPGDLLAQEIGYDGLVMVVSFSYAERQRGLPSALKGQLKLAQVEQIYEGQIDQWQNLGGSTLDVRRYASNNPEAIALFEQRVLQSRKLQPLPNVRRLPFLDLFRQVIRDFETNNIGSIGLTTLSELWGQCSVYPLALSQPGKAAVQPMILSNGQPIDPETDLCDRKGAYGPDPERLQTGTYPLSYPIMVVYPRNNRRSAIGKKFVELMRTIEGQQLLRSAGLVPLSQNLSRTAPPSPSTQRSSGKPSKP